MQSGTSAAATVAYNVSHQVLVLTNTPESSTALQTLKSLSERSGKSITKSVTAVKAVPANADSLFQVSGPLAQGQLVSAITQSKSLVQSIPQLYSIARQPHAFVLHVSAESRSFPDTYGDFSDIMAVRQTGFSLLSSSNVQEAQDLSIIAQAAAVKSRSPFLHFHDATRISQELNSISAVDTKTLNHLITQKDIADYQESISGARMSEEDQTDSSAEQVYLRYKSKPAATSQDIFAALSQTFTQFAEVTGRQYRALTYAGSPDATTVFVTMGAGAQVVASAVEAINKTDEFKALGALHVTVYRPWSDAEILAALPVSVTKVVVLEPTDEAGLTGSFNPLFLDIVGAIQAGGIARQHVDVASGRYGVGRLGVDFGLSEMNRIVRYVHGAQKIDRQFVILNAGADTAEVLRDRFAGQVLTVEEEDLASQDLYAENGTKQVIVVGEQSAQDAEKVAHKVVNGVKASKAQIYAIKPEASVAEAHVRLLSEDAVALPSFIIGADALVVGNPALLRHTDVQRLKSGGKVITASKSLEQSLSGDVKALLFKKAAQVILSEDAVKAFNGQHGEKFDIPASWSSASGTSSVATNGHSDFVKAAPAPVVESPYLRLLVQTFDKRLNIANGVNAESIWAPDTTSKDAASPEFGYGKLLAQAQRRQHFIKQVKRLLNDDKVSIPADLHKALSQWVVSVQPDASLSAQKQEALVSEILDLLAKYEPSHKELSDIYAQGDLLPSKSNWLIGSDTWAYDLGSSGVHHVITSGENVNMLIIDTATYSTPVQREQRKKDIGLYAMNYSSVYVASVAIYSSYTGVLHAMMEADAYNGPSIILAYLPQAGEGANPIEALKETKAAVDAGTWPLYRWNPTLELENKDPFILDSERIKRDLEEFLAKENHLSQLAAQQPDLSTVLVSSLESEALKRHEELKKNARDSYAKLLAGLSGNATGPPLTVLFGSDNGNAEGLAKKVAAKAKGRGLKVTLMAMDDFGDIQELANVSNLAIICCTAGQGEFPSNGREFWKALSSLNNGEIQLAETKFAIFGLGDSHYWPRPEDAGYYNKPGKQLDAKLESLGASRLTDLGLGDDQDADGFETGFNVWQPELWKALGVADAGGVDDEPPKFNDDLHKLNSNFLRGTIVEDLADESTGAVNEGNGKLLKFHGTYGQDDRDLREERRKMGLEKAYSFMIRVRVPGGVATPQQWLGLDELADKYTNGHLKLTTRQAFQFHGVLKKNLKTTIRGINQTLLSTLAACGDVNRNIMVNPNPHLSKIHAEVQAFAEKMMNHLAPKTSAYHEIWLDQKPVAGNAVQDFEPLYGPTYLPRKFKIVVAVPPNNDVDVFAHDLGYIAIVENEKLVGYNVTVGGGMGMTHNNKKTYPRPADVLGFCTPEQAVDVAEKVMTTQRDFGDRTNRKHARLKYTIDDRGLDWFKSEVESRLGYKLEEPRPYEFTDNADRYGWTKGVDDKWHFGMYIENGKVKDWPDMPCKTGLRELAKWHKGDFRLTPNQHLIIANVPEEDLEKTKEHLAKYNMDNLNFTGLRLNAMACVALPTCGLAMAESERYLPILVSKLENIIEQTGLRDDAITIRMTGCPNGCARPYLGEIAFVGKAPNTYNVYLGGGHRGERLNKLYKESLQEEDILKELEPIIKRYALERHEGEFFGDFVIRAGYVKKTITGKDFHDL
ncbi:hypothetical protein BZG36_04363 [Bifiguratus adelaidae]|uniref:assimilatory sulfite reductase (NADPH) n=1 Tax=Bifiguratus adelaidae TaxID=1938954 RepID=A0A261XVV8_9FUNG|nr:hypothetical protein BZG36_04363 [Bifiguratus adelaidae]